MPRDLTIWTIGHSTHPIDVFLALLRSQRIELLADVRSHPGSRKFPHFNQSALEASLRPAGIAYEHFPELGGRRKARPDSPNSAWRNASFRGYADYMETQEFRDGIDRLFEAARVRRTAFMCSEAVWWSCHRSLIADDLKVRGVHVLHILANAKVQEHPYTSAATIVDGKLSYSGGLLDQSSDTPGDADGTN